MSNTPGNPLTPDKAFWFGPLIEQVRHAGLLWAAYDQPVEALVKELTDAYAVAKLPSAPPPPHAAYSGHLDGKEQLMHSHGLPSH